jgi:hypothetical protein
MTARRLKKSKRIRLAEAGDARFTDPALTSPTDDWRHRPAQPNGEIVHIAYSRMKRICLVTALCEQGTLSGCYPHEAVTAVREQGPLINSRRVKRKLAFDAGLLRTAYSDSFGYRIRSRG